MLNIESGSCDSGMHQSHAFSSTRVCVSVSTQSLLPCPRFRKFSFLFSFFIYAVLFYSHIYRHTHPSACMDTPLRCHLPLSTFSLAEFVFFFFSFFFNIVLLIFCFYPHVLVSPPTSHLCIPTSCTSHLCVPVSPSASLCPTPCILTSDPPPVP